MNTLRALLVVGLALGPTAAQAAAGQVLFALGRVEVQRGGQSFVAQRGMPVEVGDVLSTGPTGLAQVRLKDGALLSLRYGSTMKVEEFSLPTAAPRPAAAPAATAATPAAAGGRSVLRLLRGAFRTVTGLIGRGANDAYQVITPVATIGIRGTDYSAAYCSGDCGTTPDGLYVGVSNGRIELSNDAGQLVLSNDQYGYVKDQASPPDRELAPPEALETPIAPDEDEDGEETRDEGGADTVASDRTPESGYSEDSGAAHTPETGRTRSEGDYELRPGEPGGFAVASNSLKAAGDNGVYTDDRGGLNGFLTDVFVTIGTASSVDNGVDGATGLRWGRWTGGTASVGGNPLDLRNQSLHWVYAESSRAALPIAGNGSYRLVGNTNPTDSRGLTGVIGDATLSANFLNQTVFSTVNLGINNEVWVASGEGSLTSGTAVFSGGYQSSASCSTCGVVVNNAGGTQIGTGTGVFNGFFTDGAAGAGLAYHLNSAGTVVTGAAAFAAIPGGQ